MTLKMMSRNTQPFLLQVHKINYLVNDNTLLTCLGKLLGKESEVVSFAAAFWMSRNACGLLPVVC